MKKLLASAYLFFTSIGLVFAQGNIGSQPPGGNAPTNVISLPNPLKTKTITGLLNDIATFLLTISVIIAGIMVIYGAFQILTAGAVPENIEKGKKTILYAVIGLGIMLLFKVLIAIIAQLLGVQVNL